MATKRMRIKRARKAGLAAAANMTKLQRVVRARKAARARWAAA